MNCSKKSLLSSKIWGKKGKGKRRKELTKDTAAAFAHTCRGLIALSKDLLENKGFEYVLLGKFTSDHIEKEFGKLRQGCGGCYFITVQQIMKKVAISKTKLLLRLDPTADAFQLPEADHNCKKCGFWMTEEMCSIVDDLPSLEKKLSPDTIASLVYIAGYVVRKDDLMDDTYFYYDKHGSYLDKLNRGGLQKPGDTVAQFTIYAYIVFHAVVDHVCRRSLCNVFMVISQLYGMNMEKRHGIILCNILFNNYCKCSNPRSTKESRQKILKLSDDKELIIKPILSQSF